MFKVNDIVKLRHKHLYWVQQGSRTLNSVLVNGDEEGENMLRARVLSMQAASLWGNILFLAIEGHTPPENCAFVTLVKHCDRCM